MAEMARFSHSRQMNTATLFTSLIFMTTSLSFAAKEGWTTDYEKALAKAKEEQKDLLVEFTGSDWCKFCIMLNNEVFKHDPFMKGVADNFILVELDFPNDKTGLDPSTIEQNESLKARFKPPGYPTVFLVDANDRPYAMTGYQEGGPEAYVQHLNELREIKNKVTESLEAAKKQEGIAISKGIIKALGLMEPQLRPFYKNEIKLIKENDPEDETGFVKMEQYRTKRNDLDERVHLALKNQKTDEAKKAIKSFIEEHKPAAEEAQELLSVIVNLTIAQEKFDEAEDAIDQIITLAPESEAGISAAKFKPRFPKLKEFATARKLKAAKEAKAAEQ